MNKLIKEFFNKRLWKYFTITFLIMMVLSLLSIGNKYLDKFIIYSIPYGYIAKCTFLASLPLIPYCLLFAISISSFIVFRKTSLKGSSNFFKLLGIGFFFIAPLAIGLYLYSWNIQPMAKKQAMEIFWSLKTNSPIPEKIETPSEKGFRTFETPNFEEVTSAVMPARILQHKLDSLEIEQSSQKFECDRLLSALPAEMAEEAYDSYKLEEMGVHYQYAEKPTCSSDSLIYIQHQLLYNQATNLSDTLLDRTEYRIESFQRSIDTILLLLSYIIFASLGYFLRVKKLTKIAGIIAVIIVITYFLYSTSNMLTTYVSEFIRYTK